MEEESIYCGASASGKEGADVPQSQVGYAMVPSCPPSHRPMVAPYSTSESERHDKGIQLSREDGHSRFIAAHGRFVP